jgi:hypothetical protein
MRESIYAVPMLDSEARDYLQRMVKAIEALRDDLRECRTLLETIACQPPSSIGAAGDVRTETVYGALIVKGVDERSGDEMIRIRGGRYMQHGVTVWPEMYSALGIDPAALRFGPQPFGKRVVVELEVSKRTGELEPRRVVGLAH